MDISQETRKTIAVGFLAWLAVAVAALYSYMLTLDSMAEWEWFTVIKGAIGQIAIGLAALAAFFRKPGAPTISVEAVEPIDLQQLRTEIKTDEGFKDHIYRDTLGNKTAGYGHLLKKTDPEFDYEVGTNIPEDRINEWFNADFKQAIEDAIAVVDDFDSHPKPVKHALINMAFNLGRDRLSGFKNTLALINAGRYDEAAAESLNSRWSDQVGSRAKRLASMISSGQPTISLA